MIKNEMIRIWINRAFAFLLGGLVLFIIFQLTVVNDADVLNVKLKKELDEIKYEPGRLLEGSKTYFQENDYNSAKRTLNILFEKHPVSKETAEGKTLYVKIEKKQVEADKKWDAAVTGIRKEWAKTMTLQLKEKFAKEKEQFENDMNNNLDREWDKIKDQIRAEWEMQI